MSESLAATILGWQNLVDEGVWDDKRLTDAVMHLDVENEGRAGEIRDLRERLDRIAAYFVGGWPDTDDFAEIRSLAMDRGAAGMGDQQPPGVP